MFCQYLLYIQYSITKYGFWSTSPSHLSILGFPFSFHLWEGDTPPCPTSARYFVLRTTVTYCFYNCVVKMCFVNIYIQYSLTKYTGFWHASEREGGGG